MALTPITKRLVPDYVFDQLLNEVVHGSLAPGDALPSERRLAELLGVSRPAVREALQRCAAPPAMIYRVNAGPLPRDHWFRDPSEGGRLLGEGCHFIDLLIHLAGARPESVHAVSLEKQAGVTVDTFAVTLAFENGATSVITVAVEPTTVEFDLGERFVEAYAKIAATPEATLVVPVFSQQTDQNAASYTASVTGLTSAVRTHVVAATDAGFRRIAFVGHDTLYDDDDVPEKAHTEKEGVRLIGADEAAEAMERDDTVARRRGDQPRSIARRERSSGRHVQLTPMTARTQRRSRSAQPRVGMGRGTRGLGKRRGRNTVRGTLPDRDRRLRAP